MQNARIQVSPASEYALYACACGRIRSVRATAEVVRERNRGRPDAQEVLLLAALALAIGVAISAQGAAARRARRLARSARAEPRRRLARDRPHRQVGAQRRELPVARARTAAARRPIVMGNRVYVQNPAGRGANLQERVMALDADTGKVDLGIQVQPVPERRAAAPHRLGVAGGRSGNRQHLRAQRRRAGRSRSAATASCCGTARSARSSPRSRRTAAGRCRRSSTATW